jgi:hypothetical protein
MLRFLFIGAAALCLAGCESDTDFWQPVIDSAFGDSQPVAPAAATADDAHCEALAHARTADAKANGFDDEMREQIYSGTYAECAAWDQRHPQPQGN